MVILFFRCLTPPGALSPLTTRLPFRPRSITIFNQSIFSQSLPNLPTPLEAIRAPARWLRPAVTLGLSLHSPRWKCCRLGKVRTSPMYGHTSEVLHHPTQGCPGGASTLESWTALKFGPGIFLDVSWTELTGETCTPYSATDHTYYACRGRCESWSYSILLKAPRRPHWHNC